MAVQGFYVKDNFYSCIRLLGTGLSCETWLVSDGNKTYAIKHILEKYNEKQTLKLIQKNVSSYEFLKSLEIPTPALLDVDYERRNILKEYVEGDSALMLVAMGRMTVEVLEQLRNIFERVDRTGYVLDYVPANFVVSEGKLIYVDHDYLDKSFFPWDCNATVERYWTRSPEFFNHFNRILIRYL